jgi:hypothetical protein
VLLPLEPFTSLRIIFLILKAKYVSRRPWLLALGWKNPSRMHGCKLDLLQVREGKYKREHVSAGGVCLQRACFSFSGAFKTYRFPTQ